MDRRWKPTYSENLARKSRRGGRDNEADPSHRHLTPSGGSAKLITSVVAAALVVACALSLSSTVSAAETKVEAETMTLSDRLVVVERDKAASGNESVAFYTNGSASKGFNGQLSQVQLRAKAKPCDGNPVLEVFVDGIKKGTATVSSTDYADYSVAISGVADGSHTLRVSYPNDYGTSRCNRDVYLDYYVSSSSNAPPASDSLKWAPPDVSSSSNAPPASDSLKWAPPALTNPTVIRVSGSGQQTINMDPARDYVIDMPETIYRGAITLNGGRNVVMIGGHIQNPNLVPDQSRWAARSLYIRRYTCGSTQTSGCSPAGSTIHIEGVEISLPPDVPGATFDAIAVTAPYSTVQLENIRAVGIQGSTLHADLVQNQGGVDELRIDKFTGTSSYQGLQLAPVASPGADIWKISRANLSFFNSQYYGNHNWGKLLWVSHGTKTCNVLTSGLYLEEVYLKGRSLQSTGGTQPFHSTVEPVSNVYSLMPCAGRVTGSFPTWFMDYDTSAISIYGRVKDGNALSSDFVPAGVTGASYISPGYLDQ